MTQSIDLNAEILKRLDSMAADLVEIKISQARVDERLSSIDQRISDLDKSTTQKIEALDKSLSKRLDSIDSRSSGQDTRFWALVAILASALISIIGILAKIAFFPAKL
jgi:hypothetical protein